MICSLKDDDTRAVWERIGSRRYRSFEAQAFRKLVMLDAVESLHLLRNPPGNRLEALKGDREGQYSIRVNQRWRICFTWKDGDAYEVEIADYH